MLRIVEQSLQRRFVERNMARIRLRTEHAGAKNGRGFWGLRAKAKQRSKKARRVVDRREAESDL
jgi:hypothetical protein